MKGSANLFGCPLLKTQEHFYSKVCKHVKRMDKRDFKGMLKSSWRSSRWGDDGCSRQIQGPVHMALSLASEGTLYNTRSPLVLTLSDQS